MEEAEEGQPVDSDKSHRWGVQYGGSILPSRICEVLDDSHREGLASMRDGEEAGNR